MTPAKNEHLVSNDMKYRGYFPFRGFHWFRLHHVKDWKNITWSLLLLWKSKCLYGQSINGCPKSSSWVLSFFHPGPFPASVTGELFPEASLKQVNKLWDNFICSISNSTNKEERLWQFIPILHQEFYPFEDYSNGQSTFTFLSMSKLFEHAFMHRFIPLLGIVHAEQSKHNVPKLLVWDSCLVTNPDWKREDPYLKCQFSLKKMFPFSAIL